MIEKSRVLTVAATFAIAAGIGYVMQNGGATAERFSTIPVAAVSQSASVGAAGLAQSLPRPPIDSIFPVPLQIPSSGRSSRVAAVSFQIDPTLLSDAPTPVFLPQVCDLNLTALPIAGAMVRLQLGAPCDLNQRIVVSHAGLEFADLISADGTYSIDVPALNPIAPFTVTFADGRSVNAKTLSISLEEYDRVAVAWDGLPGLRIHALENDANIGETGDVWAGAAGSADAGSEGGGFLIQLGDPGIFSPKLAEVYSYPRDRGMAGNVKLIVEAEVTSATCGTEISGRYFQLTGMGGLSSAEMALNIPICDGENGFLVLNNLFQDLKIAQN